MKKDSWLYSDSFLKRAFAIWGHYVVANLIIGVAVFMAMMLIMLIFGINFATINSRNESGDRMPMMNDERDAGTQGGMGVTGGFGR